MYLCIIAFVRECMQAFFTGRPPGPEMENSIDRESYSLAAGFALGNVKLAVSVLATSVLSHWPKHKLADV